MASTISTFKLSGLHCESCTKITEKRVEKIAGVTQAEAILETGELTITAERVILPQEVNQVLEGTGYQVK